MDSPVTGGDNTGDAPAVRLPGWATAYPSGETIDVTVGEDGKRLSISVADHGPGIPEDRRAEALRRFGRLDSSRSQEGAGLGLALVRAIAHLHDGELALEDNKPGLIAVLRLPVRGA